MKENHQHSDQFLKDLTKGKNPFKTPDNYFDNLSDKLATDIFEQTLPKKTGFKTPENYFENFKVKKRKSKVRLLIPYMSAAAAIVMGFFIFKTNNQSAINQLSRDEIINYLSTYDDLETNYLISNTSINTDQILQSNIENIDVSFDEIDAEFNEYDLINY